MNRSIVVLAGFLLISAGILTAVYQTLFQQNLQTRESVLERILEGEEYLRQSNDSSKEKAISIFSELSAKSTPDYQFRIQYNLGKALERNGDKYRALEMYQKLNGNRNILPEESELLALSLGDLLLKLNRENEGRVHLDSVLRTSTDRKIRSQVFKSIADYSFGKSDFETAKKNYMLAIQEEPNFTDARIGLGRTLKKQGKDWAAYDLFDDYIEESAKMDGTNPGVASEYKSDVYAKGKSFFANKQYYKAIEYLGKAVQLNQSPQIVENSLYYIASSYDALGKHTQALQYYNKVITNSIYTLDQEAIFKKGTIYFRQGKYEQAASVFQVAIEKYPKNHISEKAIAWKKESIDQLRDKNEFSDPDYDSSKSKPGKSGSKNDLDDLGIDLEF
ncbi:MAG: tetratricopeptide repeat protein [Leptospira sp.]|nr:tetratricopeptide repeat protein [Leptospira sp.]